MTGRRGFLHRAAAVGIGTGVGIALLPSPPESTAVPQSESEAGIAAGDADFEGPWLESTITTEDETPIARYQYRRGDTGYEPTAPVNVVFVADMDGLEGVMAVLEDVGWLRKPAEYVRYAWDRTDERYVPQEATAAETYYGTSGRLHARCWEFEGLVSMQVHEDTGAYPRHGIESYTSGRTAMESLYSAHGWHVLESRVDLENEQHDHDGLAAVIVES